MMHYFPTLAYSTQCNLTEVYFKRLNLAYTSKQLFRMRRGKQKNRERGKKNRRRRNNNKKNPENATFNCTEFSLHIQRKAWVVNLHGVWSIHVSILFRRSFHRIIPLFLASWSWKAYNLFSICTAPITVSFWSHALMHTKARVQPSWLPPTKSV